MVIKIRHIVIYLSLMIIVPTLSGCSSGIPQEQYDQSQSELTSSNQQLEEFNTKIENLTKEIAEFEDLINNSATLNEELSAIVAYSLWYDYYYEIGTYDFGDVDTFNSQLGSLIAAIDDTNARSAFDVYHATHYDYITLVDSLPEDNIWTQSQYESWLDAGKSRKEALGQVGGHLLNKLGTIRWFGKK